MIFKWIFWIGIVLSVTGLLLLSPLADFLPVDPWIQLKQLLAGGNRQPHAYLRAVPGEPSKVVELVILAVGVVMVAAALYFKTDT